MDAKKCHDVTHLPNFVIQENTAMQLELDTSPHQFVILSVQEDDTKIMIELRAPSTSPDDDGAHRNPQIHEIKVKDEIEIKMENETEFEFEFGAPIISVQPISTTDPEVPYHQIFTEIKLEDEIDIKIEDEMEFCALSPAAQPPIVDEINEKKSKFKCDKCSKKYSTIKYLVRHQIRHEKRIHSCDICGAKKFKKGELSIHIKTHGKRICRCNICDKANFTERQLSKHMDKVHPSKIKCPHCDGIYKNKQKFDLHINTDHNDVLPFPCRQCSDSFKTNQLLVQHMQIHAINCERCNRSFQNKHELKYHLNHHPPNIHFEYACQYCSSRMTHKKDLLAHERSHFL